MKLFLFNIKLTNPYSQNPYPHKCMRRPIDPRSCTKVEVLFQCISSPVSPCLEVSLLIDCIPSILSPFHSQILPIDDYPLINPIFIKVFISLKFPYLSAAEIAQRHYKLMEARGGKALFSFSVKHCNPQAQ